MQRTWILGMSFVALIAAGCGGADQGSGNTGGTGGSTGGTSTGGSTGGANTGGATGGANTGGATGGGNTGGATGGANTGGATGGMGGATGGGSTGGTGGCGLITEDASKIGAPCGGNVGCPTGYTCHEFEGIAVTTSCEILCEEDCQCPEGTTCVMRSDKAKSWKQCEKP